MKSIYEKALGADFDRLHPEIQRRFGFSSQDHLASIGTGIMDEIGVRRLDLVSKDVEVQHVSLVVSRVELDR